MFIPLGICSTVIALGTLSHCFSEQYLALQLTELKASVSLPFPYDLLEFRKCYVTFLEIKLADSRF